MTTKTTPIRSKKDVFEIFDGKVKIYRTNSKIYQYQLWIPEEQKYVRKSLHTSDKETASKRAEEEFIHYRSRVNNNEKIFSITASELRDTFLKHINNQVQQKQLSVGRESVIKTFTKHYLDFVGKNTKIQNIDPKLFRNYLSFRRKSKSDILAGVVINESVTIKQMYKFASDENLINQNYKPDFGVIKKTKNESVRDSYTPDEYRTLVNYSKNWYKDKNIDSEEDRYYRRLIHDFILIMSNGGFRTQECRLLKWKDISKIRVSNNEKYAQVTVREENTKVKDRRTIEMRRGDVFERIKTYSKFTEKDDYVFSQFNKNNVIEKTKLYKVFNKLIDIIKSKNSDFDETKTLYCLRHLYITVRIHSGESVWDIAKITGTSSTQISKHYDAVTALATSVKMNKNKISFDKNGFVVMEVQND